MAYGTLSVGDLLATQDTIAEIGEDRVFRSIDVALQAHNMMLDNITSNLMEKTTDRQRRYGGPDNMVMDEVDEFGRPDAQKITAGSTVGFPLTLKAISVQWTRTYFKNKTVAELAAQFVAAMDADVNAVIRDAKRALFYPTNVTLVDKLVDGVTLYKKALVNADSAAIPIGPDGSTFVGSSHTHYLGTGSFVAADVDSLVSTVTEHYAVGKPVIYINRAQEATIRGFNSAGQFVPYQPVQIVPANTAAYVASPNLDVTNLFDRAIGIWGNQAAEVWVKPWIPASYLFCFVQGVTKPLVMRVRNLNETGMVLGAEDEAYPLRARTLEHEFGIGVWERTNGAVLYTGNATYAAPTIN